MATVTTIPAYPVPNWATSATLALSETGSDYLRIWVVDAPAGSEYRKKLDEIESDSARYQVYQGDASTWQAPIFDVGGVYRLVAQEYTLLGGSNGGGYESDPDAAPSETKVGSEYLIAVYIGQKMTVKVGTGADQAELILYVWNDTIRPTTLKAHGIASPVIVNGTSDRAKMAIASTAVKSALEALHNVTAATALGTLATIISELVTKWNAHIAYSGIHPNTDAVNGVNVGLISAVTPSTIPQTITALIGAMRRHLLNDDGQGPGMAGIDVAGGDLTANPYHTVYDNTNLPLFRSAATTAEAYAAMGDFYRCFIGHLLSTNAHSAPDAVNTLDVAPLMATVHRRFLEAVAALSPSVPNTQSSGAVALMQRAGFTEAR